jgi:hypothetical protein
MEPALEKFTRTKNLWKLTFSYLDLKGLLKAAAISQEWRQFVIENCAKGIMLDREQVTETQKKRERHVNHRNFPRLFKMLLHLTDSWHVYVYYRDRPAVKRCLEFANRLRA